MDHAHLRGAAVLALALSGCAGASGPAPGAAPGADAGAKAAPATFENARWGRFHSARFDLSVGLPDGQAWKIDDHRTPWLVATHAPTDSSLELRSWNEGDLVTRRGCLAKAREWDRKIPDPDAGRTIDRRLRKLDGDLDADVAVGVSPPSSASGAVQGYVLATAASVHRCLVLVYATRAEGPGVEQAVGERLAEVADGVVGTLRLDRTFDVPRERPR